MYKTDYLLAKKISTKWIQYVKLKRICQTKMFSMQVKVKHIFSNIFFITDSYMYLSLCLNFFHLLARKPTLEKFATYSNKFFHNFHLSKSSFTCPRLLASELV